MINDQPGSTDIFAGMSQTRQQQTDAAGVAYGTTSAVTLRGVAGLDYDGSIPGIASPRFSGAVFAPTSTTPASISYAQETSYYAGGAMVVRFGN